MPQYHSYDVIVLKSPTIHSVYIYMYYTCWPFIKAIKNI